ncbi:MAG: hypothetical protein F6J95_026095 [Leptolyngbya sp. SIO1E4]|nr:hypothetical protein [Leptolyngbya sp. SIO1E4]
MTSKAGKFEKKLRHEQYVHPWIPIEQPPALSPRRKFRIQAKFLNSLSNLRGTAARPSVGAARLNRFPTEIEAEDL